MSPSMPTSPSISSWIYPRTMASPPPIYSTPSLQFRADICPFPCDRVWFLRVAVVGSTISLIWRLIPVLVHRGPKKFKPTAMFCCITYMHVMHRNMVFFFFSFRDQCCWLNFNLQNCTVLFSQSLMLLQAFVYMYLTIYWVKDINHQGNRMDIPVLWLF